MKYCLLKSELENGVIIPQALGDVIKERQRQQAKGYDDDWDDHKTIEDFHFHIDAYNTWALQMYRMVSKDKCRNRLIQVAALALAACEAIDRDAGLPF